MKKTKWYALAIDEIFSLLNTNEKGLSEKKVQENRKIYGRNVLPKGKEITLLEIFLSQLKEPITIILIVTGIISLVIGEFLDSIFIFIVILMDAVMGTFQEWKAGKSAQGLKSLIKNESVVLRNGTEKKIDSSDLVPGDIVHLTSGDKIAADIRLISSYNLTIEESVLTGESLAVPKISNIVDEEGLSKSNMAYAGTTIITGRGMGIVVDTGINTEVGKIADAVLLMDDEKSPLVIRTEKFTKQISVLILIISVILIGVLWVKGYPTNEIFFMVVALSISAIPEGLPMALTLALSVASGRMGKRNVIVKKLNSVESLGSCTVIATDKTGTLTLNQHTARIILLPDNTTHEITGLGYNGEGKVKISYTENQEQVKEIGKLACLNNEGYLELEDGKWNFFGDSMDVAFLAMGYKLGFKNVKDTISVVDSIPYESENKYSAIIFEENDNIYSTVKGSLERILEFCSKMQVDGKDIKIDKNLLLSQNDKLASDGYRVIAIAKGDGKGLKDMTLIGLVGFIDPIRKEAKSAIKKCHSAGIKVVMITGDHPLTAFTIARELELITKKENVVTGEMIDKLLEQGEEDFDQVVKDTCVFSRVSPMQKLEIVKSLKRLGEFVAVTGDGVNDAPALKTANIGIAMGSGTDVAKETSTMIITDDNFMSIVGGIEEGRIAYNNVRKVIYMLLSCGVSELLFFVLAIIFNYPAPLVAIQLLWLNLVTDGLQDVALACERTNEQVMKNRPRSPKEKIFNRSLITQVVLSGLFMGIIVFVFWVFLLDYRKIDINEARGFILLLMVFLQNVHVLNCRSESKSILKMKIKDNYLVIATILGAIGLQILVAEVPFMANILRATRLPWIDVLMVLVLSLPLILLMEIYKHVVKHLKKAK